MSNGGVVGVSNLPALDTSTGLWRMEDVLANIPGNTWPSSSFEWIGTLTLASNQFSITLTGFPLGFKHLQVRLATRDSLANTYNPININFNGVYSTTYSYHYITGVNGAPGVGNGVSQSAITIDGFQGNSSDAGNFGVGIIDILDAGSTSKNKTVRSFSGRTGLDNRNWYSGGAWYSTSPITSITITDNYYSGSGGVFLPNSTLRLYGIRG